MRLGMARSGLTWFVLGDSHDCPWVGCIGWRNHKVSSARLGHGIRHNAECQRRVVLRTQFFINFLTWSTIYTIYVFVVLVCKLSQGGSADGQMIGIAAL